MHMGAPKICSWRHIWKTGTTGMPDVHAGARRLIFLANNQRSLPCGFKKKKKKCNWINQWRRSTCSAQAWGEHQKIMQKRDVGGGWKLEADYGG